MGLGWSADFGSPSQLSVEFMTTYGWIPKFRVHWGQANSCRTMSSLAKVLGVALTRRPIHFNLGYHFKKAWATNGSEIGYGVMVAIETLV